MAKPLVLMVEDNGADALLVQEGLVAVGFDCSLLIVENAVQAYRYLAGRAPYTERRLPDLIVLDLNLPVIGGCDFMREVKANAEWRRIPIIVFTSSRREQDIREAVALGARRYLAKPPVWSQYVDAAREIHKEWRELSGAA